VSYSGTTHLFRAEVTPGANPSAEIRVELPVRGVKPVGGGSGK
jgi:hypothetical protein